MVELSNDQKGVLERFLIRATRVLFQRISARHSDRLAVLQERGAAAILLSRFLKQRSCLRARRKERADEENVNELQAVAQEKEYFQEEQEEEEEEVGVDDALLCEERAKVAEQNYAALLLQRFSKTYVPVRQSRAQRHRSQQADELLAVLQESNYLAALPSKLSEGGEEGEEEIICGLAAPSPPASSSSAAVDSSDDRAVCSPGERPSTTLYTFRSRHTKTESGLSRVFLHASDLERTLCIGSREMFSVRPAHRGAEKKKKSVPEEAEPGHFFEGLRLLHESIWAGLRSQEDAFCARLGPIFTCVRWLPKHLVHLQGTGGDGEDPLLLPALQASCGIPAASNLRDVVSRTHQGQHAAVQHQLLQLRSLRETARPHPAQDDHDAFDAYFDANEDARITSRVDEPAREEDDWRLRTLLSRGCQFSPMRGDALFSTNGGGGERAIEKVVDRQRLELESLRHRMERRSRNIDTLRVRRDLRTGETKFATEPCRSVELLEKAASMEASRGRVSPARAHDRLIPRSNEVSSQLRSPEKSSSLLASPIFHRGPVSPQPADTKDASLLRNHNYHRTLAETPSPVKLPPLSSNSAAPANNSPLTEPRKHYPALKDIVSRVQRVGLVSERQRFAGADDVRAVGIDRGRLFVQRAGLQPLFITGRAKKKQPAKSPA